MVRIIFGSSEHDAQVWIEIRKFDINLRNSFAPALNLKFIPVPSRVRNVS